MAGEPMRFDPVAWWARVDGTRAAVIDAAHDRTISYTELHAEADRWARMLLAHRVQPGDRVAILAHNRYEFLPLFVACSRTGAVLVPLNWRLAAPELARVLAHASPVLLFGEARYRALAECAGSPRWLDLDDGASLWRSGVTGQATNTSDAHPSAHPLAMLLYTSGSTSMPKGVMVSHRQILWNAVGTSLGWSLDASDIAAVCTPFFHTAAWHVFTTPLLHTGGCIVVMPHFDEARFLASLARYRVTLAFGVPTQFTRLQQADDWGRPLPALRTFISGGAPLSLPTAAAVRAAGYRIRDAYGITECGPNCVAIPDDAAPDRPPSVGWPLPFVKMRLVQHGHVVDVGEVGELQLQSPAMFDGYFADDARTAEAFTPDGWLRTGDLAVMDADGAYRICGRTADMFISGGENVFPGEVEAALVQCAGVREVVVVGVPDATWGEVGCAVIVPSTDGVSAAHILREARLLLAAYKVPRSIVFQPALPVLGSGKVDRAAVRSLALPSHRGEH